MDRFIEVYANTGAGTYESLKSNMDRFIVLSAIILFYLLMCLKSNMDRFIGKATLQCRWTEQV